MLEKQKKKSNEQKVLDYLINNSEIQQTELCEILKFKPSYFSPLLKRMEEKQLIRRERINLKKGKEKEKAGGKTYENIVYFIDEADRAPAPEHTHKRKRARASTPTPETNDDVPEGIDFDDPLPASDPMDALVGQDDYETMNQMDEKIESLKNQIEIFQNDNAQLINDKIEAQDLITKLQEELELLRTQPRPHEDNEMIRRIGQLEKIMKIIPNILLDEVITEMKHEDRNKYKSVIGQVESKNWRMPYQDVINIVFRLQERKIRILDEQQ